MHKYNRTKEKRPFINNIEKTIIDDTLALQQFKIKEKQSEELYHTIGDESGPEPINEEKNNTEKPINIEEYLTIAPNQEYGTTSYNFLTLLKEINKQNNSEMTTEEFWSEHGEGIRNIFTSEEENAETKLWIGLSQYLTYYLKESYPNNILDEKTIQQMTPKFIKTTLYYQAGIETLGEKLQERPYSERETEEETESEYDERYMAQYLDSELQDFMTQSSIAGHKISETSLLDLLKIYNRRKENEGQKTSYINERHIINNYEKEAAIMTQVEGNLLDKIVIPALRHNKTDYDLLSFLSDEDNDDGFSWYNRNEGRRHYNKWCRTKYLHNCIETKENAQGETIEYIPVWVDEFDVYWDFGCNTTTGIFDFYGDKEDDDDFERENTDEVA